MKRGQGGKREEGEGGEGEEKRGGGGEKGRGQMKVCRKIWRDNNLDSSRQSLVSAGRVILRFSGLISNTSREPSQSKLGSWRTSILIRRHHLS